MYNIIYLRVYRSIFTMPVVYGGVDDLAQVGQALGRMDILSRYIHRNIIYFLRYLRFSNGLPTAAAAGHLSFGSRRGAIFECYATTVLARFRCDSRAQDPKRK